MGKTIYQTPQIETLEIECEGAILATSSAGTLEDIIYGGEAW